MGPDLTLLQRDSLHRYLRLRAGYPHPGLSEDLRNLRELSRAAVDLARIQPAAVSASDEIAAFIDMVSREIIDEAAQEAAASGGQAFGPTPRANKPSSHPLASP